MTIYRTNEFSSLQAAEKAADQIYVQTQGMFIALEGEVWIMECEQTQKSWYNSYKCPSYFAVVLVKEEGMYVPSQQELHDACFFLNLPALWESSIIKKEDLGTAKFRRY